MGSNHELHAFDKKNGQILFFYPKSKKLSNEIPNYINDRVLFLHPDLSGSDEEESEQQFLNEITIRYEFRRLMERVVIPTYKDKGFTSDKELFQMLEWLLLLFNSGRDITSFSAINSVLVPCEGGWFPAYEAFASSDWKEYFTNASNFEILCKRPWQEIKTTWAQKLLRPFSDFTAGLKEMGSESVGSFFKMLGVSDYLKLKKYQFELEGNRQGFSVKYWHEMPKSSFSIVRQWAASQHNPYPNNFYKFDAETWLPPQIDILLDVPEVGKIALSETILASLEKWESFTGEVRADWDIGKIKRQKYNEKVQSVIAYLFEHLAWLPNKDGTYVQPNQIVYIANVLGRHAPINHIEKNYAKRLTQFTAKLARCCGLLDSDVPNLITGSTVLSYLANNFYDIKEEHYQLYKAFYNSVWESFLEELKEAKEENIPVISAVIVNIEDMMETIPSSERFYLISTEERNLKNRLLKIPGIRILNCDLQKGDINRLKEVFGWQSVVDLKREFYVEKVSPYDSSVELCGGNRNGMAAFILSIACYAHGNRMKPDGKTFKRAKHLLKNTELYRADQIKVTLLDETGHELYDEYLDWAIDHTEGKWYVSQNVDLFSIFAEGISELIETSLIYYPLLAGMNLLKSVEATRDDRIKVLTSMGIGEEDIIQIEILLDNEIPIILEKLTPALLAYGLNIGDIEIIRNSETFPVMESGLNQIVGKEKANDFITASKKSTDYDCARFLFESLNINLENWNEAIGLISATRYSIVNQRLDTQFEEWKSTNRKWILTPVRYRANENQDLVYFQNSLEAFEDWKVPEHWKIKDWIIDEKRVEKELLRFYRENEVSVHDKDQPKLKDWIFNNFPETASPEELLKLNQNIWKTILKNTLNMATVVAAREGKEIPTFDDKELSNLIFPDSLLSFQIRAYQEKELLHRIYAHFDYLQPPTETLDDWIKVNGVNDKKLESAEATRNKAKQEDIEKRRKKARTILIGDKSFEATEENLHELWKYTELLCGELTVEGDIETPITKVKNKPKDKIGGPGGNGGTKQIVKERLTKEQTNAVGCLGELLAFDWLKQTYPSISEKSWLSGNRRYYIDGEEKLDDTCGYDFQFFCNGIEYQVEVKATKGTYGYFELGSTETKAAREALRNEANAIPVKYRIIFITDILNKPKLYNLPNPYSKEGHAFYSSVTDAGAQVRFSMKKGE